jgi:hypothetical protein
MMSAATVRYLCVPMSLLAKLRFETETRLYLIGEAGLEDAFADFDLRTSLRGSGPIDQILLLVNDKFELDTQFLKVIHRLPENALFWIAYPKKSGSIASDLARDTKSWQIVFDSGYAIVTSIAIDDTWSGLRVRKVDPKTKYKRDIPMEERKTPGIDYVKRAVAAPPDAVKAMKAHKGLGDFFNTMSFTHKKEYVEAIEEAKKTETRRRRIEKMVEMVLKMKTEKENKKK